MIILATIAGILSVTYAALWTFNKQRQKAVILVKSKKD
jgi:hypothetical protein|tara:strand:+ start:494 stop:607 length:114 start_codon:yes stop_codon:yes gene_type:complete